MADSVLIPILVVGACMTIVALVVSVWGARRTVVDGQRVGDLSALLQEAQVSITGLRSALDQSNIKIGVLQASLDIANAEILRLRMLLTAQAEPEKRPAKPLLLAQCNQLFGEDDALAVRRTGIPFHRLKNCTALDFDRYLQAGRQDRATPWWVQISAHMGSTGILFADGVRSTAWLSQRIRGVRVLVLAGCENEEVGAQLVGLAVHVIVVYETIDTQNAQDFSYAFWREIGDGAEPPDAFARALEECPQVSEFVQMRTARR
jgi:hypothetical protein